MADLEVAPTDTDCSFCHSKGGSRPLEDKFGAHLQVCKGGGYIHRIHDDMNREMVSTGKSVGYNCKREPRYKDTQTQRRADCEFSLNICG